MASPDQDFNIKNSYWKVHPSHIYVFNEFYSNDKTKNKQYSSKVMWAIKYVYHRESPYYELPTQEKWDVVIDLLQLDTPTVKFKPSKHEDIIITYQNINYTKVERYLKMWEDELEDRLNFLKSIEYSTDTPVDLIKLKEDFLKNTDRMMDSLTKAYSALEKEKALGKGGMEETPSEQGIL